MKTIALLLLLSLPAFSQDLGDPVRTVGVTRVYLQPLFTWWTNAAAIVETNKNLSLKKKLPLPERPMKHWVRLTTESGLTNNGFAWFAKVRLQEIPGGPTTNKLVVLRHGPFEEKKQFDQTVSQYKKVSAAQAHTSQVSESQSERAAQLNQRANLYSDMGNIAPRSGFRTAAADYRQAARQADHAAGEAMIRSQILAHEQEQLAKATQGRSTLKVDTFAMFTGEIYQGLPVYEFGLLFGR